MLSVKRSQEPNHPLTKQDGNKVKSKIEQPMGKIVEKKLELKQIQEEKTTLITKAKLLDQQLIEIDKDLALIKEKKTHGQALIDKGMKQKEEIATKRKILKITTEAQSFIGIFANPPKEEKQLFQIHEKLKLSEAVEANCEEKCIKLKSMKRVVEYLEEHKEVKICNFETFQDKIGDLTPLLTFLKEHPGQLKAINFSPSYESPEKQKNLKLDFKKLGVTACFQKTN